MSRKEELVRAISAVEEEIKDLEQKRLRSQSSIIEAFVDKTEPNPRDAEYFKTLSSLIRLQREKLQMLSDELKLLD